MKILPICIALLLVTSCAHTPREFTQESLVAQTPMGSSRDQVRVFWAKHGWVTPPDLMMGYRFSSTNKSSSSLDIRLSDHVLPHRIVYAAWWFDRSDRLVDISVGPISETSP